MIHFIAPWAQVWIIQNIIARLPAESASGIRAHSYHGFHREKKLEPGVYIFAGLCVITDLQRNMATEIWKQLESSNEKVTLINHPEKALGRYELLRALHECGQNEFNAYHLREIPDAPLRFPVFIRESRKHSGSLTELLPDFESLEASLKKLRNKGFSENDLLVVEYCHTADKNGLFRKYSALKIGDAILPRYLSLSNNWVVKENASDLPDRELYDQSEIEEELSYIQGNSHEKQLRKIFDIARINYGRIDYGIKDGNLQVWEINTHPTFGSPPGTLKSKSKNERKLKREKAKEIFYNNFIEAVQKLNIRSSKVQIPIQLPDDLMRRITREYRKNIMLHTIYNVRKWRGRILHRIRRNLLDNNQFLL